MNSRTVPQRSDFERSVELSDNQLYVTIKISRRRAAQLRDALHTYGKVFPDATIVGLWPILEEALAGIDEGGRFLLGGGVTHQDLIDLLESART